MRTLNRPMFRYGGPIKEGVMNGIREPKRNGGSMANNEGPRRAALVGNPIYPKVDGRTNHVMPAIVGAALRFLPSVYRGIRGSKFVRGFRPTGNFRTVAGKDPSPAYVKGDITAFSGSPSSKMGVLQALKDPTRLGSAIRENPGTATSIASLLGYGGKELLGGEPKNEPGKPSLINQRKAKIGMPENLTIVDGGQFKKTEKELTEAEREAATIAARNKQMDMYKEIMDIKGMKKDATYKALIDASQLITAEGDFKGSIKDGSLIAKLIGAADKRFDKVSDTETALRSLVAKGEITKDMNKVDNELKRKKDELAIKTYEKQLKGKSIQEIRNEKLIRDGELIEGNELASLIRGKTSGKVSPKVLPVTGFKVGQDPLQFATSIIMKQNNDETTPDYPEGTYIIKDRVIYVDGNGNITPVNDLSGI